MPAYVPSRRPRSKNSKMGGGGRKVGSMRQQLKPKTAKQLEAEERRLKRFDSDSEDSGTDIPSLPKPLEQTVLNLEKEPERSEEDGSSEEEEEDEPGVKNDAKEQDSEDLEDQEENSEEDEEEVTESEEDSDEMEENSSEEEDSPAKDTSEVKGSDEESEDKPPFSGWADSIAKILGSSKPKNKKEMMLSRARKDYEVSKYANPPSKTPRPQDTLEVIPGSKTPKSEGGEIKVEQEEEKVEADDGVLSFKVQRKLELQQKKLERAWENLARMNTEKTDPEVERDLLKIATKGVVQLFNAIALQQKTLKSKLRNKQSEFQKDKILNQTEDIFDGAMSKSKQMADGFEGSVKIKNVKAERGDEDLGRMSGKKRKSSESNARDSKKKAGWSALQDDFMLDAKLKDWDQNSDSD